MNFLFVDKLKIGIFFCKKKFIVLWTLPSTHQNPKRDFRQTPLHTYYYMNMETLYYWNKNEWKLVMKVWKSYYEKQAKKI